MADYTLGIDISIWQDNNSTAQKVNLQKAYNAGARFVFIKSSQANWRDEDYVYNWQNAKVAKLLRGAYHFLVWDVDPRTQADYFYNLWKSDPGELPPVVDYEWWRTVPSNALDILWQFMYRVKILTGRYPMIYTSAGFWRPYGTVSINWAQFYLWVANYGVTSPLVPAPWRNWNFWQFTSSGDGYKYGCESARVDLNYFNGNLDALYKFAGVTTNPIPVPVFNPYKVKVIATAGLNVRYGPSITSTRMGGLYYGNIVTILEESNGWGRIGDHRWISLAWVQKLNILQTYLPAIFK